MTRVPVVRPVVHKAVRNIARASVGVLVAGLLIGQAAPALATTAAVPVLNTAGQAAAALRPADLPHGPDTCKNGFVWREARPADHVCVTPATRQTTSDENRLAASRLDPNGAFGPKSCKSGFVWREAFDGDTVCVTPDRRAQAKADNAQAAARRATPTSSNRCTVNDGRAFTGVSKGGSPERFQAVYSPSLGARWDSCERAVDIHIGKYAGTHYNLRINGKQREVGGMAGGVITLKDSELPEGTSDIAVQGCDRGSGGIFGSDIGRGPSLCSNWSPTVKLTVHLGSSN